ncbi:MAG: TIGR03067 domain-containing protein [Planctomycetota bacterium]
MSLRNRILTVAVAIALPAMMTVAAQAQSMDGQWKVNAGTIYGKQIPTYVLDAMQLNVTGSQFTAMSGNMESTGTVNLNVQAGQLTFNIGDGDDSGRELKALYQLQGTLLRITFSETGEFPTSMDSTEENKYLALTYTPGQRVAGGAPPAPGGNRGLAGRNNPRGPRTPPRGANPPPAGAAGGADDAAGIID